MKIKISPDIFRKFPKLNVGIVAARRLDNTGNDSAIYRLLEEVEELIKLNFVPEDVAKHPMVSAWRSAYSEFGSKPSRYHSSVEALMKRILKGENIPRINKLVDIYNYLSLKHLIPMGADDLDRVEGEIRLVLAEGNEIFIPLNSAEVEHPDKGEVIYRDDKNVLCRRWNWRDCDKSKITRKTKRAVIYIEGLHPVKKDKLKQVCEEAVELVKMFCNGEAGYHILDMGNPEVTIE